MRVGPSQTTHPKPAVLFAAKSGTVKNELFFEMLQYQGIELSPQDKVHLIESHSRLNKINFKEALSRITIDLTEEDPFSSPWIIRGNSAISTTTSRAGSIFTSQSVRSTVSKFLAKHRRRTKAENPYMRQEDVIEEFPEEDEFGRLNKSEAMPSDRPELREVKLRVSRDIPLGSQKRRSMKHIPKTLPVAPPADQSVTLDARTLEGGLDKDIRIELPSPDRKKGEAEIEPDSAARKSLDSLAQMNAQITAGLLNIEPKEVN